MNETAIILECDLEKSKIVLPTQLKKESRSNMFGNVNSLKIFNYKNNAITIYESGGMNSERNFQDTHLPIYADIYLQKIKNVFILGFCGSLAYNNDVNTFIVPNDFIDLTKNRERSFLEKITPGELFYYRMAAPYNPELQKALIESASEIASKVKQIKNYIVTEGPRFESESEINFYRKIGGKAVCFSGIPDVYFARELDLNLAIGLFVSNLGEGMKQSKLSTILDTAKDQTNMLTDIVVSLLNKDITADTNRNYHDPYWMQKPRKKTYSLIK